MTVQQFSHALGSIDARYIEQAATYKTQKKAALWLQWGTAAACVCLLLGVAFRIAVAFTPSQATDVFREGNLIEISGEEELPAQYDGELLAFRLGFAQYELYYRHDGAAENTADWYSLLTSRRNAEGSIVLHCMFGDTTVEDWRVSSVFTKKATQTIYVNGVEVQIAPHPVPSLGYAYWHYAIFEYDDVVYDIRVQSNDAAYVYEVLGTLIPPQ